MNQAVNLVLAFIIAFTTFSSKADDTIFMVSPDSLASYKKEKKTAIDFGLTQKMQHQFFEVVDLLNQQKIKSIIANGRTESTNSYNNNWFFVYSYNKERFLIVLPQKNVHRSNIRSQYIEFLLKENSLPTTMTENLYPNIDHQVVCDASDFALDKNYRKFYFYPPGAQADFMIKNLAKFLKAEIKYLSPKAGLALKISQILNINERMVMVCPSCFADPAAYDQLKKEFITQNKTVLEISETQAASNATDFVVVYANHQKYILINKTAFGILSPALTKALLDYGKLIIIDLSAFYEYNQTRLTDMLTVIN